MFAQNLIQFFTSKSNLTGLGLLFTGAVMIYKGETQHGIEAMIGGISLIFIKDAVAKTAPKA